MAKKRKKTYKVGCDSETYAISLVTEPAIEETFLYFNEDEKPQMEMLSTDEKHLVYGAVLVPNRKIYRYDADSDTEYYLQFTTESIEKMSQDYLRNFRQANVTLQHEEEGTEVCMVESWLKSSMDYDKSIALGLSKDLPVGTWFAGFKINNVDTWERVKRGELRGFSVESLISLEDFSKNVKNEDMDNVMLFEKIKEFITELFKGDDGFKSEESKNEQFEAEPAQAEPVQPVEPVEPQPVEPVEPEPTPAEPVVETEPVVDPEPTEPAPIEPADPKNEIDALNATLDALKAEIAALKGINEGMQHKIDELGKMPSAEPFKPNGGGGGQATSYSAWREQMRGML